MGEPDVPPPPAPEDGEGKRLGLGSRSLLLHPHRFFSRQNDDVIAADIEKLGLDYKKVAQKRNEGIGVDQVEAMLEEAADGTAGNADAERTSAPSPSKGQGEDSEDKRDDTVTVLVGMSDSGGGEEGNGRQVDAEKFSATSSKDDDEDSEKTELSGEVNAAPKNEEMENSRTEFPYPQRPGLLNCAYYMRTGVCGYGGSCRFNHPPRTNDIQKPVHEDEKELPGMVGPAECKYFMQGGCNYGSACKFSHSQEIIQATETEGIMLNFMGLPIRPGQKECPYYMRTGECKFSINCRFNHPDPTIVDSQHFLLGCENGKSPEQHASEEIDMPNCIPSFLFPPNGLNYEPKFRSQVPRNTFISSEYNIKQPPPATFAGNTKAVVHEVANKVYPERPGQPECSYYMKTGDCKFKFACKFHHPRNRLMGTSTCYVGPLGLPLRPDQPICSFYSRFGLCKFGIDCKYDHPTSLSPAAAGSRLQ